MNPNPKPIPRERALLGSERGAQLAGQSKSPKKRAAARANGINGGRPPDSTPSAVALYHRQRRAKLKAQSKS